MGLIYLDSCLLIYTMERDSVFSAPALAAIGADAEKRFAISPLIKLECLVKPFKNGDIALQHRYEAAFNHLVLLPMLDAIYVQAAQLRARFGLKTPDALHLACAQHHGCESLWTNDERLAQAGRGLVRNILT